MSSKKISVKELVFYIICGAFALWGLVYVILGLLAQYLPISSSQNPLYAADSAIRGAFGLGFLGWGLILLITFAVIGVIVMVVFAKGSEKNSEKDQRRAARLSRNKTPTETAPSEE